MPGAKLINVSRARNSRPWKSYSARSTFQKNSVLALEFFNYPGGKSQYSVCGRLGSAAKRVVRKVGQFLWLPFLPSPFISVCGNSPSGQCRRSRSRHCRGGLQFNRELCGPHLCWIRSEWHIAGSPLVFRQYMPDGESLCSRFACISRFLPVWRMFSAVSACAVCRSVIVTSMERQAGMQGQASVSQNLFDYNFLSIDYVQAFLPSISCRSGPPVLLSMSSSHVA